LSADFQTKGRGRFHRQWVSPEKKGLLVSYAFKCPRPESLTQLFALSVCSILEEIGFNPEIKWPNDIILNQKKLGGILAEIEGPYAIVGIGLNVNQEEGDLDINRPAVSLKIETEKEYDVNEILNTLNGKVVKDLSDYMINGFSSFMPSYKRHLMHRSGDKLVIDGKTVIFEGIKPDGALQASGLTFYTGDIAL
ncbi:MAG: biotin--[acetyl-CoA-carboxylase] ligase, partial [Parachlamydiaceae bacterium]